MHTDHDTAIVTPTCPTATEGYERLRAELGRPDLDDAALKAVVEDALTTLTLPYSGADVLAERVTPLTRKLVLSCLVLPPPSRPLVMPERDLVAPALSSGRLLSALRRIIAGSDTFKGAKS